MVIKECITIHYLPEPGGREAVGGVWEMLHVNAAHVGTTDTIHPVQYFWTGAGPFKCNQQCNRD